MHVSELSSHSPGWSQRRRRAATKVISSMILTPWGWVQRQARCRKGRRLFQLSSRFPGWSQKRASCSQQDLRGSHLTLGKGHRGERKQNWKTNFPIFVHCGMITEARAAVIKGTVFNRRHSLRDCAQQYRRGPKAGMGDVSLSSNATSSVRPSSRVSTTTAATIPASIFVATPSDKISL